jgi:hypothetical protein
MPKTRLNSIMREKLLNHAKGLIVCAAERDAEKAALKALTDVSDALVAAAFPERDMQVLQKYLLVSTRSTVTFRWKRGDYHAQAQIPVSRSVYTPCERNDADEIVLPKPHHVYDLFNAWKNAEGIHATARGNKLGDYRILIDNCRNYEDLLVVWPEAAQIREHLRIPAAKTTALSTLNEDVLARIAADVATRAVGA